MGHLLEIWIYEIAGMTAWWPNIMGRHVGSEDTMSRHRVHNVGWMSVHVGVLRYDIIR